MDAIKPKAPNVAATPSASAMDGKTGGPSGNPFRWANPLNASAVRTKTWAVFFGPSLSVSADAQQGQIGARGLKVGRTDLPALERSGPEVLHH